MPLPVPQPLTETWTAEQAGDYWRLCLQHSAAIRKVFMGKGSKTTVSKPKGFVEATGQFKKKAIGHLLWLSQQGRLPEVLNADAVDVPWIADWNRLSRPGGPGLEDSLDEAQWMERVWSPFEFVVGRHIEQALAHPPQSTLSETGPRIREAVLEFFDRGHVRPDILRHYCERHQELMSVSFDDWVPSLWVHRAPSYEPLTLEEAGLMPSRSHRPHR